MAPESDVPALLRRLRGRSRVAQAQAAARLRQLADRSNRRCEEIAAAGGIPLLLDLLRDDSSSGSGSSSSGGSSSGSSSSAALQQHAVAVLDHMADRCKARRPDIEAAGGVAVLVRCLGFGRPELQKLAARVLGSLADGSSETCDAISAAGGISALVRLLQRGGIENVQAAAAMALCRMGLHGTWGIKDAIVASGAVPPLVSALQASPPNPAGQQWLLCMAAASALEVLMSAKDTGGTAEEEAACSQRRASIAQAGGLQALLRTVQHSRDNNTVVLALKALWQLTADSPQRTEALTAAGGIPALVRCLASSRADDNAEQQDAAASLLCAATAGSLALKEAAVDAGALPLLLKMLHRSAARPCGPVLGALSCLALVPGQSRAILDAGAVPGIVLAAQSGDVRSAGSAAVLLFHLATSCTPDCHAAIVAAGGIPVLEQLLHRCQNVTARAAAARALRALSTPPVADQRPARVCSAPNCTNSRRLNRCGGCGAVRYCSEACRDAHWRAHRPECRRLRAEQAAAAALAAEGQDSSSTEAADAP